MIDVFLCDRGFRKIKEKEIAANRNKRLWVGLFRPNKDETDFLKSLGIHSTTREDLRHQMQRPKLEVFEKYIYLVTYAVNGKGKRVEVDFVIGRNFLVTGYFDELPFLKALKEDKRRMEKLLKLGPDFLMHYILDKAIDSYFPYLDGMDDEIDHIEEGVFSKKDTANVINSIFRARREILKLRRIVIPQQQKLGILALHHSKFISEGSKLYFRDVYDHSVRISETIEGFRDLIESTQITYSSITGQRMNEIIKVLTIMSVTLLPLTLLTGWYGMNFKHLPGLDEPSGYWHAVLAGIGIVGILVYYYKRKGWL